MEKTTERRKFGIRDIMTIAAMMVITYLVAMVIGSVTLPLPVVYLYGSAGIVLLLEQFFIWSQRTVSTNMAFCLRGPQSMG